MKQIIIKSVLFTGIIFLIISQMDLYFGLESKDYGQFRSFYSKENKSLDLLILGNSHAQFGINTQIINAKCNLESYNLSLEGINFFQLYYNLLESLKYQNPSLVIIENYPLISPDQAQSFLNESGSMNFKNPNSALAKKIGLNKVEEIQKSYPNTSLINSFNTFKNHENWSDLNVQSQIIRNSLNSSYYQDFVKSFTVMSKDKIELYKKSEFKNATSILLSKDEKIYLKKIIDLSKANKFKLLFLTLPVFNIYYNKVQSNYDKVNIELAQMMREHENIKVLDMNKVFSLDSYNFINDKVNQNQHLNYKGGIKVSNYIASYINKNYELGSINKGRKLERPEDFLYNENLITKELNLNGAVYRINKRDLAQPQVKNVVKLAKNEGRLEIQGWMYKKGVNLNTAEKIIALKKDDDFVFISQKNLVKYRKVPLLVKKHGVDYENSGYTFTILRSMLEGGTYRVYHLLKTEKGNLYIANTKKDIII